MPYQLLQRASFDTLPPQHLLSGSKHLTELDRARAQRDPPARRINHNTKHLEQFTNLILV